MCGISGIYPYFSSYSINKIDIARMNHLQAHRGPDDEGIYIDPKQRIGLGHRRLSIIDIQQGHQPMSNEDQTVWITYNGEVYNFDELKLHLQQCGHIFRTDCDTEVLIHLYEEYGTQMFDRINGIFAFVIWDQKSETMLAARDHFGVKPLYYHNDGKVFSFASELKALLCLNHINACINEAALDLCLTFKHTPSPLTLIRNIYKLEPGHYLLLEKGSVRKSNFFSKIPQIIRNQSEQKWIDQLAQGYQDATKRQMISEAPLGLSLSGGVDSGSLLVNMSEQAYLPVQSFTIAFEGGDAFNEIASANDLAKRFHSEFHSRVIKAQEYNRLFGKYMWHLEEPIGNESALAYYFVAQLARSKVKVLLNGQGVDEPFGGYPRHLGEKYALAFMLLKPFRDFSVASEQWTRSLYSLTERDEAERFYRVYSIVSDSLKEKLYQPRMKKNIDMTSGRNYVKNWLKKAPPSWTSLEKMLYIDTRTSLPDNLLLCEDKMSMACGIEARVPYLDRQVMDIAESIPSRLKVKGWTQKYIHKRTCEKYLNKNHVYRKKIGFTSPMKTWITHQLGCTVQDLVARQDSLSSQYLHVPTILKMIQRHREGRNDHKRILFLLLSIEKWHRIFILGESHADMPKQTNYTGRL